MYRIWLLLAAAVPFVPVMADEPGWRTALAKTLADKRVTIDFTDVPLADVIAHLSAVSQVALLPPPVVKAEMGGLTINVKDIALADALRLITQVSAIEYGLRCGAVVVGTPEEIARVPAEGAPRPVLEGGDPTHHSSWQTLHDRGLHLAFAGVALDLLAAKLSADAEVPIGVDPALRASGAFPSISLTGKLSALHAATLVAYLAGGELVWDNGWTIAAKKPTPPPDDKK